MAEIGRIEFRFGFEEVVADRTVDMDAGNAGQVVASGGQHV